LCFFLFSSYKRYFYCHDITGITRWDYPDSPESEDHVEEQQDGDEADEAPLDTIEYQPVVPSSSSPPPAAKSMCLDLPSEVFPGEPLPPGVDPPLPGALSANILALAGCPPPPPPMTPPDTMASDEIITDEVQMADDELNQQSDPPIGSPMSEEVLLTDSVILDPDPEVQLNMVEISAPPVLNRPSSPQTTNPSVIIEVECADVHSPTADSDTTAALSPPHVASPSTSSAADDTSTHQHRERRKKKEKVTKTH